MSRAGEAKISEESLMGVHTASLKSEDQRLDDLHFAENVARTRGDLREATLCEARREAIIKTRSKRRHRATRRDPIDQLKDDRLLMVANILRDEREKELISQSPVRAIEKEEDDVQLLGDPSFVRSDPINRWAKAPRVYIITSSGKAVKRESPPTFRPRNPKRARGKPRELTDAEKPIAAVFRLFDTFAASAPSPVYCTALEAILFDGMSWGKACERLYGYRDGRRLAEMRKVMSTSLQACRKVLG